jgi:trans-2-enoyl-CoA reductase
MKRLGGYMVVTDKYAATTPFARMMADLPKPKLALNCVGGESATELARMLGYL